LSKKRVEAQKVEIDLKELKELIRVLRENNVHEFEYAKGDYHVRIRQGGVVESVIHGGSPAISSSSTTTSKDAHSAVPSVPVAPHVPPAPPAVGEKLLEVRSPMVGTFYRSSTPGQAPFIEVGEMVRKNQVLCIVEAMKIMNEIESDVEGELVKVHVTNGQPVEYGEMLFSVRPTN
jgi:acetyl-CoA carboxylase biotin carboxyl carrier protein